MLLRSGRIKKMANNRPVEQAQEIEPTEENVNFEEARGLPNPEMNLSNMSVGQSVTQISTGAITEITNRSAGRGRGFMWINIETLQNKDKTTNENRRNVPNNPNQSLLWDSIDKLS